jgi:hypothetical protein
MKCWNSAFNAQGSRIIIAAAVKARGSKAGWRRDETSLP